jgi:integrase
MPPIKLTERSIEKLRAPDPSGRQKLHWDQELRGFGVLCSGVSKSKTYVVQRDLRDGRSRRVTIGPTNVLTVDTARLRAEGVLADFYKGIDPKGGDRSKATLRETLAAYIAARTRLSAKSKTDYGAGVERHLAAWLDRPLRTITRDMVDEKHRDIAKKVAAEERFTGHATANGVMRALRALWNFARERTPDMPANPVQLTKQWFPVPRRERLVRTDQLPAFYAAVCNLKSKVARDYLLLLLFSGLRRREAAGLRWADVDLTGRVIRIPAASTKAKRKLDLPMTDFVRDLLVARRAEGDGDFVFPSNSASGHIEEPKFPLRLVAEASGVAVSAHDLRRTYVTVAESTDMAVLALKALVNHALGNDVTSGYVKMTTERLREPAQRVCEKMMALCGVLPPAGENVAKLKG